MKVCIISSYPPKASGIGTYSQYLVDSLSKIEGTKVSVMKWNLDGFFSKMIAPILRISELKKTITNSDIIHIQYHLGDFMFMFLPIICMLKIFSRSKNNAKIVITLHEDYLNLKIAPIVTIFHKVFYKCADLLILHTKHQAIVLSKGLKNISKVIPHGVIYREDIGIQRKPKKGTILLAGFINPWKGHDLAIKAMSIVTKEFPEAKLIIAGKAHDSSYLEKIKELINKNKLEKNIEIHARFIKEEELFRMFRECEITVLPYRRITMSGILCHVISFNIPPIMSNLKAWMDFTKDNAIYFKNDDYKDFADKIILLLKDGKKKQELSEGLNNLAKEYSWESIARITYKGYEQLKQGY